MAHLRAIGGDITKFEGEVIVNAANPTLMGGGGVDGAIHRAGGPTIREECERIVAGMGPLRTGQAVITGAGSLPARHVIHTVGPVWGQLAPEAATALLASCYRASLDLAVEHDCRTIAFPCISTGVYGFPNDLASKVAVSTVKAWADGNQNAVDVVTFVCFLDDDLRLYELMLGNR